MATDGVQLQQIRNFTVQVRAPASEEIVGTGVVVSTEGDIATCAHVVRAAIGDGEIAAGAELLVHFPRGIKGERTRRAQVQRIFDGYDDDVVLLRLVDRAAIEPGEVAVLGTCAQSQGNAFQSYGYRRLDDFVAGFADGRIMGPVEAPESGSYQAEPIQLASSQINRGMSGAPLLDTERNLVVGLVSDTWFPDASTKDRDTAWAVDALVCSLEPLNLPLREEPLALLPAPTARSDTSAVRDLAATRLEGRWHGGPQLPERVVGRDEELATLTSDWLDPSVSVAALVGFGGEGKSVLARHWVDALARGDAGVPPDGVFWWTFSGDTGVDDMFDALLEYVTAGKVDPTRIGSTVAKAEFASATLSRSRYVIVLDGLEAVQYAAEPHYGLVAAEPVAQFLAHAAGADVTSFVLLTSRMQVHDIMSFTTAREHRVEPLGPGGGAELLRAAGVAGSSEDLTGLATRWDGHALTLSLLSRYLTETGLPATPDVALPLADGGGLGEVLRSYDARFSDAERAALMLVSAFRTEVTPTVAFGMIIGGWEVPAPLAPLAELGADALQELVDRLIEVQVLRYDEDEDLLAMHALIREHYRALLAAVAAPERQALHQMIGNAYLAVAGVDLGEWEAHRDAGYESESLAELQPIIEAVHHLCAGEDFDAARVCASLWINRGLTTSWLSVRLGASEAALDVEMAFYHDRDLRRPGPRASLSATAVQLHNLGRLDEARATFARAHDDALEGGDGAPSLLTATESLATIYVSLGNLAEAQRWADETLAAIAVETDDLTVWQALATVGWIAAMRGQRALAGQRFGEMLQRVDRGPNDIPLMVGGAGAEFAESALRMGEPAAARLALSTTIAAADFLNRPQDKADAQRVLGRVLELEGADEEAAQAFDAAVDLALSHGTVLTQLSALTARGCWAARAGRREAALADLRPTLQRATAAGYRLIRVDALVGLAHADHAAGLIASAQANARAAAELAAECDYAWGSEDAEQVAGVASAGP